MIIGQAEEHDLADLARLLWLNHFDEEPAQQSLLDFEQELASWWALHRDSHVAFVARVEGAGIVGMAWLAVVARVPRPGLLNRRSADVQSVFVTPAQRSRGIGSALVQAAGAHAEQLGATRVTVHSSRTAVPVYERLGFSSSRQLLQRPPD